MIKKIFSVKDYSRIINLALLVLRVTIAVLMLTYGTPKLAKIISGDFNFSDPVGLGSTTSLILVVFAEFLCSVFIAFGFGTRLAAIPLIITMLVILFIAHANDPVLDQINVLLYLAGYILLLITGGGKYSLDYYIQKRYR